MAKREGFFEALGDLTIDYTEIALDQLQDKLTNDEVLRELPVIRTIIGLARASLSIRDRLFIKKIRLFFESRDQHTKEEREEFARKLDANPKDRERTAEAIMLLLDQFDDMDKAVLLARAFSAFVREEIESLYYFRRYGEIIKSANVMHLRNYYQIVEEAGEKRPVQSSVTDQVLPLLSLGLVELSDPEPPRFKQEIQPGWTHFRITDFGRKFVKTVIRKDDIEEDDEQS